MPFVLKPLRCPYCQKPMDKRSLEQHGLLKAFLSSDPFPCPHCQKSIVYPENADQLLSIGIFVAAILTPLFYFWDVDFIPTQYLFVVGLAVMVVGSMTQKLEKSPRGKKQ